MSHTVITIARQYGSGGKTIGKMLDDQLTVEGLFSIVLMAEFDNYPSGLRRKWYQ